MRLGLCRNRIRIFPRKRANAVTVYLTVILILLILIYITTVFFLRVQPVFVARASSYASNFAGKAINSSLSEIFSEEFVSYKDLVNINTDDDGNVMSIEANISKMNYLKSRIATTIQSNIANDDNGIISIPLGSVFSSELLQGIGPRIAIKVAPVGVVNVDFADEFVSSGINQVRHKIYLDITVTISLISAVMENSETVKSRVPVAETIIVGNTPDYYADNATLSTVID